jgi:hypothetical protein
MIECLKFKNKNTGKELIYYYKLNTKEYKKELEKAKKELEEITKIIIVLIKVIVYLKIKESFK